MPQTDTRHATGWTTRHGLRHWNERYADRPEQLSIEDWRKQTPCAYHTKEQPIVRNYVDVAGGMTLQGATLPSHSQHFIVRPMKECCHPQLVHSMGGGTVMLDVLQEIVLPLIQERNVTQTRIVKYAGKISGMSEPDDHTHVLLNPETTMSWEASSGSQALRDLRECKYTVTASHNVKMVCYPVFGAGQCWMVPTDDSPANIEDVIEVLTRTNELFGESFLSAQGLRPDWSFGMRFFRDKFVYGVYTPRIASPGQEQTEACLFNDIAVPHQCTPEEILEMLGVW